MKVWSSWLTAACASHISRNGHQCIAFSTKPIASRMVGNSPTSSIHVNQIFKVIIKSRNLPADEYLLAIGL